MAAPRATDQHSELRAVKAFRIYRRSTRHLDYPAPDSSRPFEKRVEPAIKQVKQLAEAKKAESRCPSELCVVFSEFLLQEVDSPVVKGHLARGRRREHSGESVVEDCSWVLRGPLKPTTLDHEDILYTQTSQIDIPESSVTSKNVA